MSLGNECGHGKANLSCTAILLDDSADSDSELVLALVACSLNSSVGCRTMVYTVGCICGDAEVRAERGPEDIPAEQPS